MRGPTGHRIGESHHRARLTDKQVETIRRLHASGTIGYELLARAFKCGASTVRDIVKERTR
jgi:hypothetical protein